MSDPDSDPIALQAYEALGEFYAALVDTKPHNAYYERPATLSLLPEIQGKRVLDAGCGPGAYAEWLADHGAEVVAFDASEKMVRLAKERLGDRARILKADFERPLDFLEDESLDVVLSALALDYVKDWRSAFREFHRVLQSNGLFVFSVEHPFPRYTSQDDYFDTELVQLEWRGFGEPVNMPSYRRPMGEILAPILESGFALDLILEPRPTEDFRKADPEEYEILRRPPGFLCVRAVKR